MKSVIVPSVQSPPSMLKLHDFCNRAVEHVFGTLKSWLGTTPLLTKTLPKVKTEISLAVLAYNMKRMIKIMGTDGMVRAIAA
ncbi:TPA: transposase [Pseudomonas aeruginosa]|nr:transposase [Pseudomonas aeruginosa]